MIFRAFLIAVYFNGKYLISAVISPLWYKKVVSVSLSELKTNLGAKIGEKIGGDMTVEV